MKTLNTLLCLLLLGSMANAQTALLPDTLLKETFEVDPTPFMLPEPGGDDELWVNLDLDGKMTLCGDSASPTVPSNWYWEKDLSKYADPNNSALSSCSFFTTFPPVKSRNWLILPPLQVPDSSYYLHWKSSSVLGPAFVDGYKVMVSTSSNIPAQGGFTYTLFTAAEMLTSFDPDYASLDPNDYTYSSGYIQANVYTDTAYYDLDTTYAQNGTLLPYFHGALEPHTVSLQQFVGQNIYIAFFHGSTDDYVIQVDDIVVTNAPISSSGEAPAELVHFDVAPNPTSGSVLVHWELTEPQVCRLLLTDVRGTVVQEVLLQGVANNMTNLELGDLPPGIYFAVLQTKNGRAVRRVCRF